MADARVQLPLWTRERRVIFAREMQGRPSTNAQTTFWTEAKHELAAFVTDLPLNVANARQVQALYRDRPDVENVFDEVKNQ